MESKIYNTRKNKFILLGLLLIISVGFAVLSTNLNITGNSNIARTTWKIIWDNVQVNSGSVSGEQVTEAATITNQEKTIVEYSIILKKPGDFYEFTVDAKNEGTLDGEVDLVTNEIFESDGETPRPLPAYLDYTITYGDDSVINPGDILEKGTARPYKVRVAYKTNVDPSDLPATDEILNFKFSVDYVQAGQSDKVGYTVTHRYEKLDTGYDDVVENLRGEAGASVTPALRPQTGFDSPTPQTVTIAADGSTTVTYIYTRKDLTFEITDRTYVDSASTPDGTYKYGTQVLAIANERQGYTFKWSDDDTTYNRTLTLEDNLSLTPIYTESTDTPYQVVHETMDLDGVNYSVRETENLKGQTGATITPAVKTYQGFTAPQTQTTTIAADGSTVVTYRYTRNQYDLTLQDAEYISTTTPSGTYYYGTPITLTAIERQNYTFEKWSNDETDNPLTFELEDNTTIRPIYLVNSYTITLNANGGSVNPGTLTVNRGDAIGTIPTPTYTGHYLYGWYTATSGGIPVDSSYVPTADMEIFAIWRVSVESMIISNQNMSLDVGEDEQIDITNASAIEETWTYSSVDSSVATVDANGVVTAVADGSTTVNITGNISGQTKVVNVTVTTPQPTEYLITFNANGGSVNPTSKTIDIGDPIGTIPTPTYTGYYLYGWYTDPLSGIPVDETYIPNSDLEIFARWKVSVASMIISNENMDLITGNTDTINITNASAIEETWTYASNDTTKATVDQNGLVTAIAAGSTTITITGDTSGQTRTVNVSITDPSPTDYEVTLNPNGGTVSPTTITVVPGSPIGNIPDPTYADHIFKGWYTDPQTGIQVDSTYIPTGDIEIFARWDKIICKRATTLHTQECTRTSEGCYAAGYTTSGSQGTTTITYGNIPMGYFAAGNAYDCDVNDDGIYNAANERFYYLAPRGDNAVMMFYSGFEGADGPKNENIWLYSTAIDKLPTTTQWSGLNVLFDGKPARFANLSEIEDACGSDYATTGGLDDCNYILENTRFSTPTAPGRTAYWIAKEGNTLHRVYSTGRNIANPASTSENAARPVIEVATSLIDNSIDPSLMATVTFNTNGGSSVEPMSVIKGQTIQNLPTSTKEDYSFGGWYVDNETWTTPFTTSTVVNNDMDVYAKWEQIQGVAIMNGVGYETLAAAIAAAPNNTKTTIKMLADVTEAVTISSSKNLVINLNNHTITNNASVIITNSGTLEIENGNLNFTGTTNKNVIKSTKNLIIRNCNITSSGSSGAVENSGASSNMLISDTTITTTGTSTKQALYNDGGTMTIDTGSVLTSESNQRATVHNLNSGTLTILGGTITSNGLYAVYNAGGTLVIGENDGVVDTTAPIIRGKTYGVVAYAQYEFYDGAIEGQTYPIGIASNDTTTPTITNDTNESKISAIETDSQTSYDTETVGADTYQRLTLVMSSNKYKVTFDANGGEVSPAYKNVDAGDPVGTLPVPTKGIYTFDGWYTNITGGVPVDATYIPTASIRIFAHWSYHSSSEVVQHDMVNDPMEEYYDNIATWKNDESTFQSVMQANFNANNCQCADNTCSTAGTVQCDMPTAYDTGVGGALNVYLNNKTTGDQVYYTNSSDGVLYNMIPGQVYYWELAEDPDVFGYVQGNAPRRLIQVEGVRNLRDLGGLPVDTDGDGVTDGTTKYGKLFRGTKLGTDTKILTDLSNLGITEEVDLRNASEHASSEVQMDNFKQREIKHYQIDKEHYATNYNMARSVLTEVMQDVISGENVYFHCRIGADRTGTLAYILEGLLGVKDEERLEDYETTFFFGLVNRHRYFSTDPTSSVSKTEKFVYMYNFMKNNQEIYDWFMEGTTDQTADEQLIANFRQAMINSN